MTEKNRSPHVGFSRILGLSASLALGLSVSIGLVIEASGDLVLAIAGEGVHVALILGAILYLPVLLTYAEMAAGKPASASAYQISRVYGNRTLTFLTGWLMLSGLVSAAALLALGLALRLDFSVQNFFNVDVDHFWILVGAVALGGINEWLTNEDRWRSRTILVWLGLAALVVVLAWAAVAHPLGRGELPRIKLEGHDLTTVALLGMGLWFADLLLNHRRQMREPDRTLKRSMIGVWFITLALAMIAAGVVRRSPSLLMEFWPEKISWGEERLEFLLLVVGVLFVWLGLSRLVSRTVRLTGAMAMHGFLPPLGATRGRRVRALTALLILGAATVLAARWVPAHQLVAISAASFLLVTAVVTFPYARRPERDLQPNRRNRLPLHPLFPGVSIVACLGLVLVLPRVGQAILLGWTLVGAIFYLTYAGRRSRAVQQDEVVVGEVEEVQSKVGPRILIGADNLEQLPSLLKLGLAIGLDRGAEIVVLRVLPTTDELSMYTAQRAAEKQWEELDARIEEFESRGVVISSLVRIAPSAEAGILAAARQYDADVLLMGVEDRLREAPLSAVLSGVFAATSLPLIAIRGQIEEEVLDVVVGTGGGPHSALALELGAGVARFTGGEVELVSVVPRGQPEELAQEALASTLEKARIEGEVPTRIIQSHTIESGLLEASKGKPVLVLGASIDRLLKQTVLGGLPLEISRVREGTTLVVKRAEAAMRFW